MRGRILYKNGEIKRLVCVSKNSFINISKIKLVQLIINSGNDLENRAMSILNQFVTINYPKLFNEYNSRYMIHLI